MASAKKKLSGKVLIDVPGSEPGNLGEAHSSLETSNRESSKPESSKHELKPNSEAGLEDGRNQGAEGVKPEDRKPEISKLEYRKESKSKVVYQTDSLPETVLPESLTDYKKVAMRLSAKAAERLRQLRADTGIPYEILVDVMIRHWDELAKKTKSEYMKEATAIRQARLLAGQQKAIQTMQQKYNKG